MKSLFIGTLLAVLSVHTVFAVTLGKVTVRDPRLGYRTITYEKINDYAVAEGDILIAKMDKIEQKNASISLALGGRRWLNGIVPFELAEELPLMSKLYVLESLALWQQHTNIEFIELNSRNREQFPDYLYFVPANGTTCSSFVGRQTGRQAVNLAPRCNAMNTAHEVGHALGLWHEQSRLDRDNFVYILWENIDEDHRYNFDQHLNDGQDFGEYDYQSIMHYGPYNFSKNGKKTMIPLVDNVDIGQRDHLSEKDIAAINSMYPETGG